jgi:hypothetical protein
MLTSLYDPLVIVRSIKWWRHTLRQQGSCWHQQGCVPSRISISASTLQPRLTCALLAGREWEHRVSGVHYISRDSKWRMHWRAPVGVWTAPHVILRWLPQCLQMADAPHFVQYAVWRRGHPEHLERMQEAANTLLRSVLKIDAPNSQLVVLEFIHCSFSQVELVCVPQLARLVYDTWFGLNPPVRFGYVHRLQDIWASSALMHWQAAFTMSGWLSNTTSLSTLSLDFYDEMVCCKCSIV